MTDYSNPNKARIDAVFNHELPDRVPNFEVLVANPTLRAVMGRDIGADHTLANIDPYDYIEFVRRIGQDVIGMCFYSSPFRTRGADGELKPLDFRVRSRDDLYRVEVVGDEAMDEAFALLDRYVEALAGTDIGLFVLLGSFFTEAYDRVFGFENFMISLYERRDLIEEVLELHADYYAALAARLVTYPLTFYYVGDDLAYKTSTLVRPELLRELWMPRMQRVFDPALAAGIPILYHSDGNIEAIIPDLLGMGIDALNPIEPYGMDIRAIKRRYGENLTLVGNLDVGGVLSTGTPDEVRVEARQLIDDVGQGGNFILASCHSITSNVRPENFLAMVETAWTARYR